MRICKSVISSVICIIIAASAVFTSISASANSLDSVTSAVEGVISYKSTSLGAKTTDELLNNLSSQAGTSASDWYYIALSLYGVNCRNSASVSALKSTVNSFYSGDLADCKVTDMQRVALALLACGESITDVNGHNLLADCTYNRAKHRNLDSQGVNSVAYALLLLDSKNFSIPDDAETNRTDMVKMILDKELESGGFALMGSSADTDVTAIAVQALSPYKSKDGVKGAVDKSLSLLSSRQSSDGSYKSFSGKTCAESTAQVILALVAEGINPASDGRFIKDGNSVVDGLLQFKLENGAFSHFKGEEANNIATYQSLCALVGCSRYMRGSKSFYDFTAGTPSNTTKVNQAINKKTVSAKSHSKTVTTKKTKSKVAKKAKNKADNKQNTSPTESKSVLKSTSGSSKITFTKVIKAKKKKPVKVEDSIEPEAIEKDESSSDEAEFRRNRRAEEEKKTALYITFAVLFVCYPVLVVVKTRKKDEEASDD